MRGLRQLIQKNQKIPLYQFYSNNKRPVEGIKTRIKVSIIINPKLITIRITKDPLRGLRLFFLFKIVGIWVVKPWIRITKDPLRGLRHGIYFFIQLYIAYSNNKRPVEGIKTSKIFSIMMDIFINVYSNNKRPVEGIKTKKKKSLKRILIIIRITKDPLRGLRRNIFSFNKCVISFFIRITKDPLRGLRQKSIHIRPSMLWFE